MEKDELIKKLTGLQNAGFFMMVLPQQDKKEVQDTVSMGCVQYEMLDIIAKLWRRQYNKMQSPADFEQRFQLLQKEQAATAKEFDAYVERYASNKLIADFAKDCRAFIPVQEACMNERLLKELFAFYPDSVEHFMNTVASNANITSETVGMKPELAKESFGDLVFAKFFAPEVIQVYAPPIVSLLSTNKGKTNLSAEQKEQLGRITKMLDSYFDFYIRYWGGFTDRIPISISSWAEFQQRSRRQKAYQTNTLLLTSYISCRELIQQIPDVILSENVLARKKQAVTLLSNRIQILSPDFAQSCANVCNSWASLPDSAEKAFSILHNMPQKSLRTDYLLVFDSGEKGDIPWWSRWVKCGVSLLYRDAKIQLYQEFVHYQPMFFSFPLCRKAPYPNVLMMSELEDISRYLTALGCSIPAEAPEKKEDLSKTEKKQKDEAEPTERQIAEAEALEQLFGKDEETIQEWKMWGNTIQQLLDCLTNPMKPLTYSLFIPSEAEQRNLTAKMDHPLPLAIYRYPYVQATSQSGKKDANLVSLNGSANPELLAGLASDSYLCLNFYSFENQEKPDYTISYDCKWAVLKLYLSDHSCLDPKTKKVYSAVVLPDRTGKNYILWIGYKFNKVVPTPSEWPSASNCPDFSKIQKGIKKITSAPQNWQQKIAAAEAGEAGYNVLKLLVCAYPLENFPEFSIFPLVKNQETLLKTPYLEISTPQNTTRILITNTEKRIPIDLSAHQIAIRLFRFSDEKEPAYSTVIKGPYALLRLLTMKGRVCEQNSFVIPVDMVSPDGKQHFNMTLDIRCLQQTK